MADVKCIHKLVGVTTLTITPHLLIYGYTLYTALSLEKKKQFCRILLFGNLEKLAKIKQAGRYYIFCHVNVQRNKETRLHGS